MSDTVGKTALVSAVEANLSAAASVALYFYVAVAVLKQSDAELILPSSVFDLGGLLDQVKEGIPGGSFITPILQVKLPLTLFYTLGPVGLLFVHTALVLDSRALARAAGPLRFLAIWAPPVTLALIRWRFAPYVAARPEPPPVGLAMEALQTVALACDSVIVVIALLRRSLDVRGPIDRATRWRGVVMRGCRHGTTIWLLILLLAGAGAGISKDGAGGIFVVVELLFAVGLLVGWLEEGRLGGRLRGAFRGGWFRLQIATEDLNVIGRAGLLGIFIVLAALPRFARALDLSGQSLVAKAPSETLIQTLLSEETGATKWNSDSRDRSTWLTNTGSRIADARMVGWQSDGRGINLAKWNFPGGRFDRATMALIRLSNANLQRASLDFANLVLADLSGANMSRASLRSASLDRSNAGLRAGVLLAAATQGAQSASGSQNITKLSADEAAALFDKCQKARKPVDVRTDFSGADLTGAHLNGADLSCANLVNAKMVGNADLTDTRLVGADLEGANLSSADLTKADVRYVQMNKATNLDRTDLTNVDLSFAHLRGVDFRPANGVNSAIFDNADVTCAIFPADFEKSKLQHAIITGARLDGEAARLSDQSVPTGSHPDSTSARSLKETTLIQAVSNWPDLKAEADWTQLQNDCKHEKLVASTARSPQQTPSPPGQPGGSPPPSGKP